MVDPDVKISLKVINEEQSSDYRSEWQNAGVNIFADIEYTEGIRRMKWLNENIIGEL